MHALGVEHHVLLAGDVDALGDADHAERLNASAKAGGCQEN